MKWEKRAIVQMATLSLLAIVSVGFAGCPSSDGRLTAQFLATPESGAAPLNVSFTDQSVSLDAPIQQWLWLFGDGFTSSAQNPVHTYLRPGQYSVTLIVSDGDRTNQVVRRNLITVGSGASLPVANFEGRNRIGAAPLTVTFLDRSLAGAAAIEDREWNFGDGNTSTAPNPTNVYTRPGRYSVSLTVGNSLGSDTRTFLDYVEVTD